MNSAQEDRLAIQYGILSQILGVMNDDYNFWLVSTPEQVFDRVMKRTRGHYNPEQVRAILFEE